MMPEYSEPKVTRKVLNVLEFQVTQRLSHLHIQDNQYDFMVKSYCDQVEAMTRMYVLGQHLPKTSQDVTFCYPASAWDYVLKYWKQFFPKLQYKVKFERKTIHVKETEIYPNMGNQINKNHRPVSIIEYEVEDYPVDTLTSF